MRILAVHQGAELYGSDRSFLTSIKALRDFYPDAEIDIILHEDGPLANKLADFGQVKIIRLAKLSYAEIRKFNFSFLWRFVTNLKFIRQLKNYDILYVNTIVILDFIVFARLVRKKTKSVIHVREIQHGIIAKGFRMLLNFSKATLIFNSERTHRSFFEKKKSFHHVVENGVPGFQKVADITLEKIKLLIVGRINGWKGQDFFLRTFSLIDSSNHDVELRIVGSVFGGQDHFRTNLDQLIQEFDLGSKVQIFDFTTDIEQHIEWSNIVVVPSKKPEPFGRVAIEGMSAGRALLVADHGGLADIVDHGITGLKFSPNDLASAKDAVEKFIANPSSIAEMGSNGKRVFLKKYSEDIYRKNLQNVFKSI